MSNIDKRALREAAEKALPAMQRLLMMPNDELFDEALLNVDGDVDAANAFNLLTGPETVLALLDELEAAEKRIAELSASHGKLREAMAGIHNTIRGEGAYTPLAAILSASKRAYEESASAAGKGE
ncbi:TPA: ead/Ea22-like family protein [Escherichia coli]